MGIILHSSGDLRYAETIMSMIIKKSDKIIEYDNPKLLMLFDEMTILDDDVTLRSYFKMFEKYTALSMYDYYISSYLEEYKRCPAEGCVKDKINFITLIKLTQIDSHDNSIYSRIDLIGISDNDRHSFSMSKLDSILDIPLKLGKGVISDERIKDPQKWDIYKGTTEYTFFEFMKSIIRELSFFGTPNNRNEECDKLNKQLKDIEENPDKQVTYTTEEVFQKLENKLKGYKK